MLCPGFKFLCGLMFAVFHSQSYFYFDIVYLKFPENCYCIFFLTVDPTANTVEDTLDEVDVKKGAENGIHVVAYSELLKAVCNFEDGCVIF